MKRLPGWMLALLVVLTILLLWIGWEDRHEAGYLPFVLGIAWAIFTLASLGRAVKPDEA
jgi:hypothetical protein